MSLKKTLFLFSLFLSLLSTQAADVNCNLPPSCPVCEVLEEWPMDFNGDDFAEKAERRKCFFLPVYNSAPEIMVVYDQDMNPIIYKSTLDSCNLPEREGFTTFERIDFNNDTYDELLLVEAGKDEYDDEIKVIGFLGGKIRELSVIDFSDLIGESQPEKNDKTNIKFDSIIKNYGFKILYKAKDGSLYKIHYYQDSADRSFYPLKTETVYKAFNPLSIAVSQFKTLQPKKPDSSDVEFIE
jgi:hypothetical protein